MKTSNGYQQLISDQLYEKIPKAILAALVVSYLLNHQSIAADKIDETLKSEWVLLHEQGIVPQKPPK